MPTRSPPQHVSSAGINLSGYPQTSGFIIPTNIVAHHVTNLTALRRYHTASPSVATERQISCHNVFSEPVSRCRYKQQRTESFETESFETQVIWLLHNIFSVVSEFAIILRGVEKILDHIFSFVTLRVKFPPSVTLVVDLPIFTKFECQFGSLRKCNRIMEL